MHNRGWSNDKPRQVLEGYSLVEFQAEIRRSIGKVRVAQEILASLIASHEDSIKELIRDRTEALGSRLTGTELEVTPKIISGQSPEVIAWERGLSERTIGNQLNTGCHKLGFGDRCELKG